MRNPAAFIITPVSDQVLFIFTPILVFGVFVIAWLAGAGLEAAFVAATVGAAGHHLPGMMRAYADKELFSQFRRRFIAAPVILVTVCSFAMYFQIAAVNAVMLIWGFWHGLAQIYGFARIYDRKAQTPMSISGRADLILLIAWFAHGVIASDNRMAELAALFVDSGFGFPTSSALAVTARIWLSGSVLYTLWYVFRLARLRQSGFHVSSNKLLILALSLVYWNVVMIAVPITIVSIAMFELFHDVQYLAIVWSFNRNRKDRGALNHGFARLFYNTGTTGLGLYLLTVLIYGSFALGQYWHPDASVRNAAIVFFTVSTLLHFYYDGFIWKLRQPSISGTLNAGRDPYNPAGSTVPAHAGKWAILIIVLVILAWLQQTDVRTALERSRMVREAVPASFQANKRLAVELEKSGDAAGALSAYRATQNINPSDPEVQAALIRLSSDVPFEIIE
jgi:uncharacterized membrane protein YqhA